MLSIGWLDFEISHGVDSFEKDYENMYGDSPRSRWSLYRFLFVMKPGDMVIVPKWGSFGVYEIESDAYPVKEMTSDDLQSLTDSQNRPVFLGKTGCLERKTESGIECIDLGFFRRVRAVASEIPRTGYADSKLTARMKIRQTNADITDLQESVRAALDRFRKLSPFNLSREILSSEALHSTYQLILKNLNPARWERLIGLYFQKLGADVVFSAKNEPGKEGDSDITATFEALKTIYHIQAKFHEGTTASDWALRQIQEYCQQKENTSDGYTTIPWVVSSAEQFSSDVVEKAKENNIQLISGMEFVKMLLETGIARFDEV